MATDVRAGTGVAAEQPSPSSEPVRRLEHVTVRFGGITALDDVDLELRAGEVCGLIGPNGAGKTTLFDVISGVRPPEAGRVVLDGSDITRWGAVRRARAGLRRTFQRVQTYGWLSSADNVLAALEWEGGGGGLLADLVASPTRRRREQARREQVDRVLEFCGVDAVRDEPAGSLPIGTARMVEVARAMVERPRVLLLDEPTSGLEDSEVERLADRIRAIRGDESCAVLLVEHDVGFVMGLCDRVVVLDLGRVLATGRPDEIQSNADVRAAYLGEP
ncbi:MAG TPA: ABC transporter ATP-binding protein [Acidimicrobiia bacterium]|nr:ABC transporter ATP-binding protein [Acidimicrobiia bacterium]